MLVKIFSCKILEILANLHEKIMCYLVALFLIKKKKEIVEGDMDLSL